MGLDRIAHLVTQTAQLHPDRAVIRSSSLVRTYAEFDERTNRLAHALLDGGLVKGDRVAAWLDTCPQYIELYLAVAKAGLVLVPINSLFTEHEASYQLEDSGASALFHVGRLSEAAERLAARFELALVVPVGDFAAADQAYEDLLARGSDELPPEPGEDDLYVLSYTSGTTGRPKGAMVTHRTLMNTCRILGHSYRTPLGSVCIYHANMSFVATVLALIMGHLFVRGTIVLADPGATPEEVIELIGDEKGTFTFLATPWLEPMTKAAAANPEAWQQVRAFLHSASKASPDVLRSWADVIGHRYMEVWGMTEASGCAFTVTTPDEVTAGSDAVDFFASVGRPAVEVAVRVMDEWGNELPHDGVSVGELAVQSPSVVVGYWNRPEATAAAFRDGWFHTGDLGVIDAAGYIYVTERRTDLIVSGGMNVYPSEIERTLLELHGVRDAAVIGIPHERWGETPVAFVVTAPAARVTEEDVLRHCAEFLARYKRPSQVRFLEELPRNASQKVLKRILRDDALL
jgi:acyl-CoA synthetase (AMP-forming)/AMP-acid ligase II